MELSNSTMNLKMWNPKKVISGVNKECSDSPHSHTVFIKFNRIRVIVVMFFYYNIPELQGVIAMNQSQRYQDGIGTLKCLKSAISQ